MPNPNPKEDDEMTKTTFRMPKTLLKEVKHYAIEKDMTDTQVFVQALRNWMTTEARKEAQKK